jgi:hypothetical protein
MNFNLRFKTRSIQALSVREAHMVITATDDLLIELYPGAVEEDSLDEFLDSLQPNIEKVNALVHDFKTRSIQALSVREAHMVITATDDLP